MVTFKSVEMLNWLERLNSCNFCNFWRLHLKIRTNKALNMILLLCNYISSTKDYMKENKKEEKKYIYSFIYISELCKNGYKYEKCYSNPYWIRLSGVTIGSYSK